MKIYTKTGDKGSTALIGGMRVPKHHQRIEAYGTVDELISFVGLIRDQPIDIVIVRVLIQIQDSLMTCAAVLATDCEDQNIKIPQITEKDIQLLEMEIDAMESQLPVLQNFVLPGGHTIVSFCHIARTVCRRCERLVIKLSDDFFVPENVLKYMNRLSDYLFVLGRKLGKDFNIEEIQWPSKL